MQRSDTAVANTAAHQIKLQERNSAPDKAKSQLTSDNLMHNQRKLS